MLLFDVNGQTLKRTDHFNPATDSLEYLKAKFTFNDSAWSGKTKTALFRLGTAVYKSVLGTDGTCKVPSEVLVGGESRVARIHGETIHVSLIGEYSTIRITTNEIAVKLNRSGYADAETPSDPTESEYQQMTAVAADAVAEAEEARAACENARADLVGVKNLFANAIKGNLSGAVVVADDASPVEHEPIVYVHGKNIFDTSKIPVQASTDNIYISAVGEGYIDITTKEAYDGNGHCVTWVKLKELCPQMRAGKQYALSATTTAWNKMIYLKEIDLFWNFGGRQTVTEEMLECTVGFYGLNVIREQGTGTCRISNIQCEEGYDITEYTPYIDPSTVTVTRCGKNFWHSRGLTYPRTVSGVTVDYDADSQIYTFSGTSTSAGDIYTVPNGSDIMHINAGETWTLKVEVMGGNIDGVATSSGKMSPLVNNSNYTNTIHANAESLYSTKKYTEAADITKMYFYVYASGIVFNNFKCRIQFEPNSKPTEFEKFKELSEYTPASDGTVSDITSLSPNMTILTDTDGAIVECEYIRDTNKVIEKLTNAIIALGGTV